MYTTPGRAFKDTASIWGTMTIWAAYCVSYTGLVLLAWPSTNQMSQNWSHDGSMAPWWLPGCMAPCWLLGTFLDDHDHSLKRPTAVSGKWVALNYLDTSFVCIRGLVGALRQCSNGLRQIMHSHLACALSSPRLLQNCPCALNPGNAHKTGI